MIAQNHSTESALLDEVSQQARTQGADRLSVWEPDSNSDAGKRWSRHGFQPTERNPEAAGVTWEKPL